MVSDRYQVPADDSPQAKKARLAQLLRQRAEEAKRFHPLSSGQRTLWFLHQLAPESAANNEAFAWRHVVSGRFGESGRRFGADRPAASGSADHIRDA